MIFVRRQRGLEQAGEECVCGNFPSVGDDGGAEPERRGGIVRRRIGFASEPPMLPRVRTCGSPIKAGKRGQRRDRRFQSADPATSAWVVIAPIVTFTALDRDAESSDSAVRSISAPAMRASASWSAAASCRGPAGGLSRLRPEERPLGELDGL